DDVEGAAEVAIISKPLADRLFANGDAVGQNLAFGRGSNDTQGAADASSQELTIVGVTGDFPTSQMSTQREQILLPLAQHFTVGRGSVVTDDDNGSVPRLLLIARSTAGENPQRITAALENVVREINPEFQRDRIVTGVALRRR